MFRYVQNKERLSSLFYFSQMFVKSSNNLLSKIKYLITSLL